MPYSGSDSTMVDNEEDLAVHVDGNMELAPLKAVLKVS